MSSQRSLKRLPEAAAVLLILVLALALSLDAKHQEQTHWIAHTLEVQAALSDYEAAIFAAESGQRGFIMSREESYLDPYHQALAELPKIAARLKDLVADSPEQMANVDALGAETDSRVGYLAKTIANRRLGDEAAVQAAFQSRRGQTVMLKVRSLLKLLSDNESGKLAARRAAADSSANGLKSVIALGGLLLVGSLGIWIVSARRQQHALTEANNALRASIEQTEAAAHQIRQMQKMEAIGQLTGGIAHDFNNMLAIIVGGIQLASRRIRKGEAGAEQYLSNALEGAQRAASLVKRMLAFSKQQPLTPSVIDVNKLVAGMSELIDRALGETIKVETVLAGGLWRSNVDTSQLENAILNLCVNARDAMPDGGHLTVETANSHLDEAYSRAHPGAPPGQYVLVAVTDNGEGMSSQTLTKAFDPFFSTKPAGKGTGLGLSQVYGFVKQSGGHIKIYSEQGHGTTVKIYLPRHFGELAVEAAAPVPPEVAKAQGTILIVEDEPAVRAMTAAHLKDAGYTVIEATDAKAALALLAADGHVDLLLTDIVMPGMNGRKLADEALKARPDLRLLFMTGFTRNAVVHNGVVDQGVTLLTKPFTAEELCGVVQKLLR